MRYWLTSQWNEHEIVDGVMSDLIMLIGYLYLHRMHYQTEHIIRIRRGAEDGPIIIESVPGQPVKSLV